MEGWRGFVNGLPPPARRSTVAMPMERFLAAVVQMTSGPRRDENLARATEHLRYATARGARLVVLPEVFAWRGAREDEAAHAESIPGPTTGTIAALARETGAWVVAGSILERSDGDGRSFNTSCVLSPDGSIAARYRKLHLFDVDLPGRVSVRESDTRAPGDDVVAVPTDLGTLGVSICYDLRFPELYRQLVRAGAELLLLPAAFTFVTGAAHWEILCRARAIENQCWLLAANQTGMSPHGFADYGHSMIVDPWGTVVARAGDEEGVVLAEIDRTKLARVRRELPCLEHARLR
jgi:predicted amidohydrolase